MAGIGPAECRSGRRGNCANVGSLDPEKLGYCPPCYDYIRETVAIPFDEFRDALEQRQQHRDDDRDEGDGPRPLDGTIYSAAMVWSARLKCEKCKQPCPAGSLVLGTPGTKTVMRAYDPGTYVWRGPVGITKLRHPDCVPLTKRMISELKEANASAEVAAYFRGGTRLSPSVHHSLEAWVQRVTSDEAEEERKEKRKASLGINPDGTKKARGNFKPKGPPESWKQIALKEPEKLLEKSATALKNFLKTYTYEKVPKSITKKKLADMIVGLFTAEESS